MQRLRREVLRCANISLYRDEEHKGELTLIHSYLCDCKLCFICNQSRWKATRRKYLRWFASNETIVEVENPDNKSVKYVTRTQASSKYKSWSLKAYSNYDIMHLTLTVPHTVDGFDGEKYYFDKLSRLYWLMRKNPEWNRLVFGGEYGIETTRSNNGLHIHIHSLLLVRREIQNRNKLHKLIFFLWNKATVDQNSTRESFDKETIAGILKGNRTFTEDFVATLNPKGGTNINLETIYAMDPNTGQKIRNIEFNSEQMIFGVLEAISYHFSLQCFDKENKTFDFNLMADIMPKIYRKALYKKFGCLHGETVLNLSAGDPDSLVKEYEEEAANIDKETGEILLDSGYYIINPAHIFHHPEKEFRPIISNEGKKSMINVDAFTTSEAVNYMGKMIKQNRRK